MTEDSQVRVRHPHTRCTIHHSFLLKKWTTFTQTQNTNWIPCKKSLVYVKAYITALLITSSDNNADTFEVSKGTYFLFCWWITETFHFLYKNEKKDFVSTHTYIYRDWYAVLPKLHGKLAKFYRKS